ncbi:DUF6585 family protein [Kitasatospora sp. NPDC085464]|uniref:DUF6585 family protein n=1 Tax=Kitasatospora sp. NPDC085464 TaxID=3364063 RepID=UPI0037CA2BD4
MSDDFAHRHVPSEYSEQVAEAVARQRLGDHRATYLPTVPSPTVQRSDLVTVSVLLALLVSAGTALARTSPALLLVFLPPVTVLLLFRVLRERYNRSTRKNAGLHLHEHGLVVVVGGKLRAMRWDTMTVHQNIGRYHTFGRSNRVKHAYTLRDDEGQEITLREGFPNPEDWGPRIQQAVTEAQLADALIALRAGKTMPFGSFLVSRSGVAAGRKQVSWSQVQGVHTRRGFVRIEAAGKPTNLTGDPVWMFPNLQLFTALVEQLRR